MKSVVNLRDELETVAEYCSPRIVGRVNDQYVKVAKIKGEFVWHKHDEEDEMFFIVKGRLVIRYEDHAVTLNEGEFHVVPKGVMHNPLAEEECWLALIEPVTTKHAGDTETALAKSVEDQLAEV